ncbi:uncharacterized protein [Ciconia boyciana]|uniref:uncharacterized protein n=1 Tax=Ciconia boyciana TaxID=52775 RepID=UPI003B9ED3C0
MRPAIGDPLQLRPPSPTPNPQAGAKGTAALNRPGLELPGGKRERNEIPTVPGGVWESLDGTDHNPPPRLWPPTPKLFRRRRSSVVAAALRAAQRGRPAPLPAGPAGPPPAGRRRSGATPAPPAPSSALTRQRHRPPPFSATSSSGAQPAALASPTHFLSSIRSLFPPPFLLLRYKINEKGPRVRLVLGSLSFFLSFCSLEIMKGSHEEQARRPRTLGSRRRHRTHIFETNQNRQLWGAVGEPNTSPLWLGAEKILSAKQMSWALTCGPYFVTESRMRTVTRIA